MTSRLGPAVCVLVLSTACGDDTSGSGGAGATSASSNTSTAAAITASGSSTGSGGSANSPFSSLGASSFETQPTVAADGRGGVVVAWVAVNADGSSAVGYTISRDGGVNFGAVKTLAAPEGRLSTQPVLATDSTGQTTLAWLGFRLDFQNPDEHIYVSRLDAQSETFAAPQNASDDGSSTNTDYDRPWLGTDAAGDILLSYANFTGVNQGGPASLVFARSADAQTFSRSVVTSDATFGNLAEICLDRSLGMTAPLTMVHLGNGGSLTLRQSQDGGASWQLLAEPGAYSVVFQPPTCAVRGSSLFVAYGAGAALFDPGKDSPADTIKVLRSLDGGQSFAPPVDAAVAGPTQYLFPRIVAADNNKLEIVYFEGIVNQAATLMHASSDGGTQWSRSPIVQTGTLTVDLTLASWLGGTIGLAIPGATGFVAFAENTQAKTHIGFAEVALP